MKKKIIVLGATGTIGKNTLDVIKNNPDLFELAGISAHSKKKELLKIAKEYNINKTALSGTNKDSDVLFSGEDAVIQLLLETEADIVVNGIAGAKGLLPSITALKTGKNLALANKESLVMAGEIIKETARKNKKSIIPVDSEHSAVFLLLEALRYKNIDEIILTASGGAFRNTPKEELQEVTPNQALNHPTWNMGKKITIDSASLANKGLEVLEAEVLFDLPIEKIKVVIHPQSIIHAMVRQTDGSLYAQLSYPDMKTPIQHALSYPDVLSHAPSPIDITQPMELSFYPVDNDKFPMLDIAYQAAGSRGKSIAFNAANEEAVDAFLCNKIKFTDIPYIVELVINHNWTNKVIDIEEVLLIDKKAREIAKTQIRKIVEKR
ncbi:1-deoxy-D-xylulose-5-phosphate reductoisomerase [Spirochaetia bacterium 38H-sp]|uniref:1-deoxy-D-xylulose 5-phosphate reductoisomerase n=1 Tax=Rarispira pelagica TaxID=3141764 RepID=A0ABU9UBZ1_9SPIR